MRFLVSFELRLLIVKEANALCMLLLPLLFIAIPAPGGVPAVGAIVGGNVTFEAKQFAV